jgi:hypothetical protein
MNKLRILSAVALVAAAFNFTACDEEHTHSGPTVTINSPTGMFDSGDTITLSVRFEDDHELHEYAVTVTRVHDGEVVQTFSGHTHDMSFMLVRQFAVTTSENSDFRIDAVANNHDGLEGTATANFHVHPR